MLKRFSKLWTAITLAFIGVSTWNLQRYFKMGLFTFCKNLVRKVVNLNLMTSLPTKNYAKDGKPEAVWLLRIFYHDPFLISGKTKANDFVISNLVNFETISTQDSLQELARAYKLCASPYRKVRCEKDHGKNYIKVRPLLPRHLLHNRLLRPTSITRIPKKNRFKV